MCDDDGRLEDEWRPVENVNGGREQTCTSVRAELVKVDQQQRTTNNRSIIV